MEEVTQKVQNDEEEYSKNQPVSKLPWYTMEPCDFKLEHLNLFRENTENSSKIELYRLLTQVFPFYLPKRYHSMDCKSLQENSKDGLFWTYASQFVFCNQAHGHIFFDHLLEELKAEKPNFAKFRPAFNPEKKIFLDADLELECKDPAEFLLEPWVLLQLPFQPVLLHQWAVALLAEALRFQQELVTFYCIGYPRELKGPVKKLINMCKKMQKCALNFLGYFNLFAKNAHLNIHKIIIKFIGPMLGAYPEILPIIRFVLSRECSSVIVSILEIAGRSAQKKHAFDLPAENVFDFELCCTMYSYTFWKQKAPPAFLYLYPELTGVSPNSEPLEIETFCDNHHNDVELQVAKICSDAMYTDPETTNRLLQNARDRMKLLMPLYQQGTPYTETSSLYKAMHSLDSGVIYNIIRRYSDVKAAEAYMNIARILSDSKSEALYLVNQTPMNHALKELTIGGIIRAVANVTVQKEWCYKEILTRTKANIPTCAYYQFSQELSKIDAETIASFMQTRIQRMVIAIIEKQYKTLKGPFHFYPESQFIQYLLPCFVASFLELEKSTQKEGTRELGVQKYLEMVHNLISNYEDKLFCQILTTLERKPSFSSGTHHILGEYKNIESIVENVSSHIQKFFCDCSDESRTMSSKLIEYGLHFLAKFHPQLGQRQMEHIDQACPWTQQVSMLLSRMQVVLIDINLFKQISQNLAAMIYFVLAAPKLDTLKDTSEGKVLCVRQDADVSDVFMNFDIESTESLDLNSLFIKMNELSWKAIGYITFHQLIDLNRERAASLFSSLQGPAFSGDATEMAMWSLVNKDLWRFRQLMLPAPKVEQGRPEDMTLVTLPFAKNNSSYESLLKMLTSDGKVPMEHPGEITFFPIQHCRWCGFVEVEQFRVCPECVDDPDYVDVNIFCSEKCEKICLDSQHIEEHARAIMIRCGIID